MEQGQENPLRKNDTLPTSLSTESKSTFPSEAIQNTQKDRLHEIRIRLGKENKEVRNKSEHSSKPNGFEPFVGSSSSDNQLFINGYNGNFAQQMELNREGVEELLKTAHFVYRNTSDSGLDHVRSLPMFRKNELYGQITLTALANIRKPSSEIQGNELVAKQNLFFGDKAKKDNEQTPLHRVVSTPDGWRIEINDTRMREELQSNDLTGKELQKEFIKQFNKHLKQGIWESVWREKFTNVRDNAVLAKMLSLPLWIAPFISLDPIATPFFLGAISMGTAAMNVLTGDRLRERRHLDARWEYFMPWVEFDKAVRAYSYLSLKGRTLVREKKS